MVGWPNWLEFVACWVFRYIGTEYLSKLNRRKRGNQKAGNLPRLTR